VTQSSRKWTKGRLPCRRKGQCEENCAVGLTIWWTDLSVNTKQNIWKPAWKGNAHFDKVKQQWLWFQLIRLPNIGAVMACPSLHFFISTN